MTAVCRSLFIWLCLSLGLIGAAPDVGAQSDTEVKYPERVVTCISLDDQAGLLITLNESAEIFTWMVALPVTPPGGGPKAPSAWHGLTTRSEGQICRFDEASGLVFFGGQFPADPKLTHADYLKKFQIVEGEMDRLDAYFALPGDGLPQKLYLFDGPKSVINSPDFGSALEEFTGHNTERLNYFGKGPHLVEAPFFGQYRIIQLLPGTTKAGAIQRRGMVHRPTLAFELSAYGDPLETAGRLGAAYLSAALSKYYVVDLQESASGARLLVSSREAEPSANDRDEMKRWARLAERDLRRAAKRGADRADVSTLRERRLLERALRRDNAVEHLAHLARRLRFVSPETLLAEEQAFALLDVSTVNRALDHLAKSHAPQLWLPIINEGAHSSSFVFNAAPGKLIAHESWLPTAPPSLPNAYYEQATTQLSSITLFFPLPDELPPARNIKNRRLFWPIPWYKEEIIQPPAPNREEAAQLINAKYAEVRERYPETFGRVSARLPSLLPGVLPDPTGSNQFSAITLVAKYEDTPLLLEFAAAFQAEAVESETIEALRRSISNLDFEQVEKRYNRTWQRQAALVIGSSAEEILNERKLVFENFLRLNRRDSSRFDLLTTNNQLPTPVIHIVGPRFALVRNEFVKHFSTKLQLGINWKIKSLDESPSTSIENNKWKAPGDRLLKWQIGDKEVAPFQHAAFVSLEATPERHAAMLVIAEAWREFQRRNNNPIYQADATLLDFPDKIGWYMEFGPLAGGGLNQWHLNLLQEETLFSGLAKEELEARIEQLWIQRRTHAAQAGNLSFLRARDIHLYDDPLWRDKVDAALLDLTREDILLFSAELAEKLAPLSAQ